jgi:hypothetical protein
VGLQRGALLLEQRAAAQHDVAALLVELDDFEVEGLADVLLEVAHGAQVDLRAGEEGLDADVDSEAALDPTRDRAVDQLVALDRSLISSQILSLSAFSLDRTIWPCSFSDSSR